MSRSTHEGECKLCGQVRPLCRSHIVPEFAYEPIKNEKGQLVYVGRKWKTRQVGYRERLLCSECEGRLSAYETEFKKAWMDTIPHDFSHLRTRTREDPILVPVPDFASFTLFHLSVFWRAAVSGFGTGRPVWLGPYGAQLRDLIYRSDPGDPGDFPFFAILNLDTDKRPDGTIVPLAQGKDRADGHHYYRITYAYCDWTFVIARPGPKDLVEFETQCRRNKAFMVFTQHRSESEMLRRAVEADHKLQQDSS